MSEQLFEEKTIDCPPDVGGLFRAARAIAHANIPEDQGQAFVCEMLEYAVKLWTAKEKIRKSMELPN